MARKRRDAFDAFIAGVDHPTSVDDLEARFRAAGLLTAELVQELIDTGLKARLRNAINRDRLPNGLPRLRAVSAHDADGRQMTLYAPPEDLEIGQFVELWKKARSRKRRGEEVMDALEREFQAKFADEPPLKQLALTWGDDAGGRAGEVA